jgi:hypothetical protein
VTAADSIGWIGSDCCADSQREQMNKVANTRKAFRVFMASSETRQRRVSVSMMRRFSIEQRACRARGRTSRSIAVLWLIERR